MPCCMFYTNVPLEKISEDFESNFTKMISELFDKPDHTVKIVITPARVMTTNSKEPSVTLFLYMVDRYSPEKNPSYTRPLCQFISQAFHVPIHRCTVFYEPLERYQIGHCDS